MVIALRGAAASPKLLTDTSLPMFSGIAGVALTLLLAGMVYVLAAGRSRARAMTAMAAGRLGQAEVELRQQAALHTAVLNAINEGVAVVDEDGKFVLHNPAATRLLAMDLDRDGTQGWPAHYGIFLPNGVTRFPDDEIPLTLALADEPSDGVEMVIRNPHIPDWRLISVDGRPLEWTPGRRAGLAVFRDITAQRQHEAELAAFAGVVAHDLKGTLAAISLYGEMALAAVGKSTAETNVEKATRALDRLAAAVASMRRLISDLLAYATAREAPLQAEPVDLVSMIEESGAAQTDSYCADTQPDIRVGLLPVVAADRRLLRQLLDNLIGNAMKYVVPGEVPQIDISAYLVNAGWARIEIADRGIGIPTDQVARVFEPFYRAHSTMDVGGTGLGLAICRRVVDRHGGLLGVSENPGGGSRFHFTLPLAEAGSWTDPLPRRDDPSGDRQDERRTRRGGGPAPPGTAVPGTAPPKAAAPKTAAPKTAPSGTAPSGTAPRNAVSPQCDVNQRRQGMLRA